MLTLIFSFFIIAVLYATVGFGGGSSYLALLAISDIPFSSFPKIALICNLLVVSGGSWIYYKRGHFDKKIILPLVLSSVPMSFLGGLYPIEEKTFLLLLATTLIFSSLRLLFVKDPDPLDIKPPSSLILVVVGGFLGFLSGLVGIGGGIFLSPLMLNLKWAQTKVVAATASFFILLNSTAGLIGQFIKTPVLEEFETSLFLFLAVVVGGQIGSRLGNHQKISSTIIRKATALLILYVAGRLYLKLLG